MCTTSETITERAEIQAAAVRIATQSIKDVSRVFGIPPREIHSAKNAHRNPELNRAVHLAIALTVARGVSIAVTAQAFRRHRWAVIWALQATARLYEETEENRLLWIQLGAPKHPGTLYNPRKRQIKNCV